MFSGIVTGNYEVTAISQKDTFAQLSIATPPTFIDGAQIGASIAVNGVCLTVTRLETGLTHFDVIAPTLERTNLAGIKAGDFVNMERSLIVGQENGGHDVSGHVDTTAEVVACDINPDESTYVQLRVDPLWMRYMFPRGFVAVNGASLTIAGVQKETNTFELWLIPETLRLTNLASLTLAARVNIEIHKGVQVLVDTIRDSATELLKSYMVEGALDIERVQELAQLSGKHTPQI